VQVCAELLERGGVDLLNDRDSLMISPMDMALQAKHEAVLEVTMSPKPCTIIL
jgi:dihydropteroate synthase